MPDRTRIRSYLYCPGSSERLLERVLERGADAVVLDLEDAVAPERRPVAREAVARFLDDLDGVTETPVLVRVNAGPDGVRAEDLDAVVRRGLAAVRVPKCEDLAALRALDDVLGDLERRRGLEEGSVRVQVLIESAAGVQHAAALAAAPRVERLCFGATDFLADIEAQGPPHGEATWYARGHLVVASRVAGIAAPVDSVHTDLDDEVGLRQGAELARRYGFGAKSVIHPVQLPVVHEVFGVDAASLEWARAVLAAAERSSASGEGALTLGGQFIDAAVVGRARRLLGGQTPEGRR